MSNNFDDLEWVSTIHGLPSKDDLVQAEKIYLASFPPDERMPWEDINYDVWVGRGRMDIVKSNSDVVGFAFTEHMNLLGWHYLSYLATTTKARGKGLGGFILGKLQEMALADEKMGIIFDIEHPKATVYPEMQEVRSRRMEFYCRHGAHVLTDSWTYRVPVADRYIQRHLLALPVQDAKPPSQYEIPLLVYFIMTELYQCPIDDANLQTMLGQFKARLTIRVS